MENWAEAVNREVNAEWKNVSIQSENGLPGVKTKIGKPTLIDIIAKLWSIRNKEEKKIIFKSEKKAYF